MRDPELVGLILDQYDFGLDLKISYEWNFKDVNIKIIGKDFRHEFKLSNNFTAEELKQTIHYLKSCS